MQNEKEKFHNDELLSRGADVAAAEFDRRVRRWNESRDAASEREAELASSAEFESDAETQIDGELEIENKPELGAETDEAQLQQYRAELERALLAAELEAVPHPESDEYDQRLELDDSELSGAEKNQFAFRGTNEGSSAGILRVVDGSPTLFVNDGAGYKSIPEMLRASQGEKGFQNQEQTYDKAEQDIAAHQAVMQELFEQGRAVEDKYDAEGNLDYKIVYALAEDGRVLSSMYKFSAREEYDPSDAAKPLASADGESAIGESAIGESATELTTGEPAIVASTIGEQLPDNKAAETPNQSEQSDIFETEVSSEQLIFDLSYIYDKPADHNSIDAETAFTDTQDIAPAAGTEHARTETGYTAAESEYAESEYIELDIEPEHTSLEPEAESVPAVEPISLAEPILAEPTSTEPIFEPIFIEELHDREETAQAEPETKTADAEQGTIVNTRRKSPDASEKYGISISSDFFDRNNTSQKVVTELKAVEKHANTLPLSANILSFHKKTIETNFETANNKALTELGIAIKVDKAVTEDRTDNRTSEHATGDNTTQRQVLAPRESATHKAVHTIRGGTPDRLVQTQHLSAPPRVARIPLQRTRAPRITPRSVQQSTRLTAHRTTPRTEFIPFARRSPERSPERSATRSTELAKLERTRNILRSFNPERSHFSLGKQGHTANDQDQQAATPQRKMTPTARIKKVA